MRRKSRLNLGRFLMSAGFVAGFVIRDLMEESSPVREAVKDVWKKALNFVKPAGSDSRKTHFPDMEEDESDSHVNDDSSDVNSSDNDDETDDDDSSDDRDDDDND